MGVAEVDPKEGVVEVLIPAVVEELKRSAVVEGGCLQIVAREH